MVRATTGGVMKTYRSNLMGSFVNMNANRNTVLSQRTFNSFAEDPATAARAFRLRKSRMTVESQYNICTDVMKKYQAAVACLQSNDDVLCTKDGVYGQYMNTLTGTTFSMLNDPTGDAREQLNKVLDQLAESIVQTMNQKYGDNFIFAGADGHNVPFEIRENKLYYRGVPVDAAIPNVWKDTTTGNGGFLRMTLVNDLDPTDGTTVIGQHWAYDPTGAGDHYLKMDNIEIVYADTYNSQYTIPETVKAGDLRLYAPGGDPIVYDSEGNPIEGSPTAAGYYKLADEDGNPTGEMISVEDYNADLGFDQPVEYNPDGSIKDSFDSTQEGGWYKLTDGTLISKQEYNEAVYRAENKPTPLEDINGNLVLVDKDGNPSDDGEYYLVYSGEIQTISQADYDTAMSDYEKLQYLANEKSFVDIGLGFQEDDTGKLIETSAFNAALSGLSFLGYGMDEDGDPKNLYSLVQKMREVSGSVDDGTYWSTETWDEFNRLVGKFEKAVSNYQTEFVNLDASTGKLSTQQGLLEDNFYNLQEQYSDLEDVDMVDAITSFIWAEYCYNAALKVGNSILGPSLMDYLS